MEGRTPGIHATLTLSCLVLSITTALAQPTWRRTYGAFGPDDGRSVRLTDDGAIVIAASTGSFGAGTSDIYLFAVDGDGEPLWSRTIGGSMIEQSASLIPAGDGGWLIAGSTNDAAGHGGYDGLLVRTDAEGTVIWQRTYGGSDWDFFRQGCVLPDGSFLLAGQTFSQGVGGDAWLVCTTATGDTLWTRHFGGPGLDDASAAIPTTDGGYVFAGSLEGADGDSDAYVVKLDAAADTMWTRSLGGDSTDLARDIVQTQDGGFSLVGGTHSFSPDWMEHYHVKLDASGGTEWQKHWGQVNDQQAFQHLELAGGGYATTGWTKTSGGGGKDMFLLLSDAYGEFISQRTYGGAEDDAGAALALAAEGYVLCGSTTSFGAGGLDVFVVRTDVQGATATEDVEPHFDPLRVEDVREAPVVLFHPNPCAGMLELAPTAARGTVELLDVTGRVVRMWRTPATRLDLSGYADGRYLLRGRDEAGRAWTSPLDLLER